MAGNESYDNDSVFGNLGARLDGYQDTRNGKWVMIGFGALRMLFGVAVGQYQ
jgi:hypothetical protein